MLRHLVPCKVFMLPVYGILIIIWAWELNSILDNVPSLASYNPSFLDSQPNTDMMSSIELALPLEEEQGSKIKYII